METVVYTKIISFIYPHDNLTSANLDFWKTDLGYLNYCLFSHIYSATDKKNACDVKYLDFKKAFDSVPHNALLFKLWHMGITGL